MRFAQPVERHDGLRVGDGDLRRRRSGRSGRPGLAAVRQASTSPSSSSRGDDVARLILAEEPGLGGDRVGRSSIVAPMPPASAISAIATSSPPSATVVDRGDHTVARSAGERVRRSAARRRDRPAAAAHPRGRRSRAARATGRDGRWVVADQPDRLRPPP